MILMGGLVIGRLISQSIIYYDIDKLYPTGYYWLMLIAVFLFLFFISGLNMILLRAHYIKKFNFEKDECKYIDLSERIGF